MPRFAPPWVALFAIQCCALGTAASTAAAATTVTPVRGEIRAVVFSGDAVVIARQPPGDGLKVERLLPGAPAQILVRTRLEDENDEVSLAGSAEALAVAVNAATEGFGSSRVLIGPPAGPLREVARCRAGVLVPPVAVAGSQIAWRDGGCARPARYPNAIGPATIAIANVDPLLPARRISVPGKGLPASLVLAAGDTGLVGLLLPQPNDELSARIRPFAPTAIGAPIAVRQSGYLLALGILGDGTHVFAEIPSSKECIFDVFAVAPASGRPRVVAFGGCPDPTALPVVATGVGPLGDRIVAIAAEPGRDTRRATTAIVSVRGDGGDRRVVARGTFRTPLGVAAEGDRVAWWQPRCAGGSEIVVRGGGESEAAVISSCRAEIRSRSAQVRNGRIGVRVRCPHGCTGLASVERIGAGTKRFSLAAGTHTLRLRVALGRRARARVRVELEVDSGQTKSARISVRR